MNTYICYDLLFLLLISRHYKHERERTMLKASVGGYTYIFSTLHWSKCFVWWFLPLSFSFFQMKFTLKQIMRVILEFSIVEVLLLLVLLLHRTHLRSILIIDLCFLLLLLMLCSVEYIVYLKVRDTGAQCVLCFALHLSL